jgi:malonyl CoA-acyl carrier protein transacylase
MTATSAGTHDAPHLLVLSARTPGALAALARRFAEFLPGAQASLAGICSTAAQRRTHHEHRLALAAASAGELAARLAPGGAPPAVTGRAAPGHRPRLVFMFPGQGTQYVGMGSALYRAEPAFRAMFDRCEAAARPHLDWSLAGELLAGEESSRLGQDEVVQPLLFAIQVSLAAAWRSRGVEPDAVVGHSMGETAAAHVAGALSLGDAARIACLRANLLGALRGQGAMAVVGLSHRAVTGRLAGYGTRLHLAAANGPSLSVLSGDGDAIDEFLADAERQGVFCRRLRASGAGHSPVVEPVARAVTAELAGLHAAALRVPMYSSVTGAPVTAADLDGAYWGRNLRQPVLFHPAVERLRRDGYDLYLEMSPHPALVVPTQQALDEGGTPGRALGSLVRGTDDRAALLEAFGALHVHGLPVDFSRVQGPPLPVTSLPSGPWERRHVWFRDEPAGSGLAPPPGGATAPGGTAPGPVLDTVATAFAHVLRVQPVDPGESFFALGGTSLMAAQMLYELRSALGRDIPLRLLFENPTVSGLTAALESARPAPGTPALPPLERAEADTFPLSLSQERLLTADPRFSARVVAQHLLLTGPLDMAAVEHALGRAIAVHEGLRTVIVPAGDGAVSQRLAPYAAPALPLADLSGAGEPGLREYLRETERPFPPDAGPLYRFSLARLDERRHVLSVVVDHLLTDGWSMGVLLHDLRDAYEARLAGGPDALAPPPLRLVDYARWERGLCSGAYLDDRLRYWREKLSAAQAPRLRFVRHAGGAADGTSGGAAGTPPEPRVTEAELDLELAGRLEDAAQATGTTTPIIILTGFLVALRQFCDQDVLTVPANAAGRDHPGLDRAMGFLAALRLVTVDFPAGITLRQCLERVRDEVLEADEQQQPISLSQYMYLSGLAHHTIPFRVSVNQLPDVRMPSTWGEAGLSVLPQTSYTLSRDILLVVRRVDGRLRLSFGYAPGVVDDAGMRELAAATAAALRALAADPDQPVPTRDPEDDPWTTCSEP